MKMLNSRQPAVRVLCVAMTLLFNTASAETLSENSFAAPLELAQFIKNSLKKQPQLLAAQADIESAKANLRASKQAIYNPELALAYENASNITKTIGINQTIDWGDQRSSRTAVASAELDIMSANYTKATHDFINSILNGLAEYQSAQQLRQLSDETLQLMQTFKRVSQQQYQAGDLNQVDLNLAILAYSQATMEQARVVSSEAQAQENLRAILGGAAK